ncbi:unnamed protein product [Discula destructiva]
MNFKASLSTQSNAAATARVVKDEDQTCIQTFEQQLDELEAYITKTAELEKEHEALKKRLEKAGADLRRSRVSALKERAAKIKLQDGNRLLEQRAETAEFGAGRLLGTLGRSMQQVNGIAAHLMDVYNTEVQVANMAYGLAAERPTEEDGLPGAPACKKRKADGEGKYER